MKPLSSYPVMSRQVPGLREQGSVLVISLLILLIMSLLSITSINNAVLEEKMAANSRNNQFAFQAAEAALRAGETYVSTNMVTDTDFVSSETIDVSCTNGLCDCDNRAVGSGLSVNGCPSVYWIDNDLPAGSNNQVWDTPGNYKDYSIALPGGTQAKYIIEYMGKTQPAIAVSDPRVGCSGCPDMYRVTALGENIGSGARVMLQSTFRKN